MIDSPKYFICIIRVTRCPIIDLLSSKCALPWKYPLSLHNSSLLGLHFRHLKIGQNVLKAKNSGHGTHFFHHVRRQMSRETSKIPLPVLLFFGGGQRFDNAKLPANLA
jgi:hypothetical protein